MNQLRLTMLGACEPGLSCLRVQPSILRHAAWVVRHVRLVATGSFPCSGRWRPEAICSWLGLALHAAPPDVGLWVLVHAQVCKHTDASDQDGQQCLQLSSLLAAATADSKCMAAWSRTCTASVCLSKYRQDK